ncbi:hypothetical protein [Rathayibacter iranicus]|uniref:hypothetical protein n=1 Tax=Rathayibacter iranicus TaxID=59737 RepID=UPI0013661FAC|nr:hypothetical protein [Rathayibacter iranicus]
MSRSICSAVTGFAGTTYAVILRKDWSIGSCTNQSLTTPDWRIALVTASTASLGGTIPFCSM